jgi:hypothetical protein
MTTCIRCGTALSWFGTYSGGICKSCHLAQSSPKDWSHIYRRWAIALATIGITLCLCYVSVCAAALQIPRRDYTRHYGPGSQTLVSLSSSLEDSIVRVKIAIELYSNPVGWTAMLAGYDSSTLFILRRDSRIFGYLVPLGPWFMIASCLIGTAVLFGKVTHD